MRFGAHLTHYRKKDAPEPAVEFAEQAEELGFATVWVGDHPLNPKRVDCIYPYAAPNTRRTNQASGGMPDPFVLLAVIGGRTSRIKLGFTELVIPYRPQLITAKQVATLDALTGGRVILGVGVGWHVQEFEALEVSFEDRHAQGDEAIALWRKVWSGENVEFDGQFTRFETLFVLPRPAQAGGPPIWVGGDTPPDRRRAALLADGWIPTFFSAERYKTEYAEICRMAAGAGRPKPTGGMRKVIKIVDTPAESANIENPYRHLIGTPDQVVAALKEYEAAGVEEMSVSTGSEDPNEVPLTMERFARDIMPAFR